MSTKPTAPVVVAAVAVILVFDGCLSLLASLGSGYAAVVGLLPAPAGVARPDEFGTVVRFLVKTVPGFHDALIVMAAVCGSCSLIEVVAAFGLCRLRVWARWLAI